VYRRLLPIRPDRCGGKGAKIYQRSGLAALRVELGSCVFWVCRTRTPDAENRFEFLFLELGKTFPAKEPRRARVALFASCISQVTFSDLNRATIRVLQANGCEVVVAQSKSVVARWRARWNSRHRSQSGADKSGSFSIRGFDAIITNAAGCRSTLRNIPILQESDPSHQPAEKFSAKVQTSRNFSMNSA
jgi:glycolate oxidase iron-sulfur subunit